MLNTEEKTEIMTLLRRVAEDVSGNLSSSQTEALKRLWRLARDVDSTHDQHNIPHLPMRLGMAHTYMTEVTADVQVCVAVLLSGALHHGLAKRGELEADFDKEVVSLAVDMERVEAFAASHAMGHQENFSGLLLTLSTDIRVVIALIVRSLVLMQRNNLHPDAAWVAEVALEARMLYSELAHRLGLYSIKSVLEDLWLKYTDRPTYKEIARRLSQTMRSRDAYIARFIEPVSERLTAAGLKFTIKGRTKSIFSIWNKIQLKEVDIEDLLPRDKIEIDLKAVEELLTGKSILITGAAGSIGSEMVRQIAKFTPQKLILIDQAETPLHDVRLMMARKRPDIEAETIVSDICMKERMEEIFGIYRPDYVFHAAAYKHVPMMENNPGESVRNNVEGTRIIADLAVKYRAKKFVMVSTDKAVNPTNVMGCSKRICEIYVQSLDKAEKDGKVEGVTQFVTTRFGNVLGSNGSVIPLFKEQIKQGGPITVTHPDIIRFFMLIPEACKLVLEAGTMGNGGEIFVFDMGKPVKIVDLARRMIQLSGAKNVEIKFTGLRDGEKLYEEVLNEEETTKPTFHPKIKIAQVREYDYADVCRQVDELVASSVEEDDMEIVKRMKEMVPEFKSKHSVYEVLDK